MIEINNNTTSIHGKPPLEVFEIACLSQITVLTLFGNGLVILAFIYGPRNIRNYTNYFVVNLSVADLMVGFICQPFWIFYRANKSLINQRLFKVFLPFDLLFGVTSIFNLAVISIERVIAVWYPSVHINLPKRLVIVTIIATWLGGIILSASMYGVINYRVYTGAVVTIGYLIPLLIIIASYCAIFHAAIHMMRASNEILSVARELRVAKTISLVIGLFVLCWSPFFILNLIYVFCDRCSKPVWLIYVSKMMHYSNSMMNFFIYAARSPDFQKFFRKVLCPSKWKIGRRSNLIEMHALRSLSLDKTTRPHIVSLKNGSSEDTTHKAFRTEESFESYLSDQDCYDVQDCIKSE